MEAAAKEWYDGQLYPYIKLVPLKSHAGGIIWCFEVHFRPTTGDGLVAQTGDGVISHGSTRETWIEAVRAAIEQLETHPEIEVRETNDEDLIEMYKREKKNAAYWRGQHCELEAKVQELAGEIED